MENLNTTEIENQDSKSRRGRPTKEVPLFPRHSLSKILSIAQSIENDNAGKPYDRLSLAKSLNYAPNSSTFRDLITSSQRYGLTKGGRQADKIGLTDLGSSIVAPTSNEEKNNSLIRALNYPSLFKSFFQYYAGKQIPREEIFKNSLKKEFKVAYEDVDTCYKVIFQNMNDYGLLENIKGNFYLKKNFDMVPLLDSENVSQDIQNEESQEPNSEINKVSNEPKIWDESLKPRVFISHSKNKKILEQIKQMLEFGSFEYEVAVERETTSIPIPEKIFGLMRKCKCAVINVSADESEKREDGTFGINQNVLIEIGAAFLAYDKRVILLVDKRMQLPSNLQGLYLSYYEGDELSWETGMNLQKALTEFRTTL